MSIDKINKITSSLMSHIDGSEKLALPLLAAKAHRTLNEFPDDPTTMSMASVLTRMADKKLFITRGEFRDIYRGFYTRNNQFAEVFSDELGKTELKGPTYAKRASEEGSIEADFDKLVDPVLANGLRSAFDKNEPLREYSDKTAAKAKDRVDVEFKLMNVTANTKVLDGNSNTILVVANFETPKGTTSVYVPVEANEAEVLTPSCFLSNRGVEDFTQEAVTSYVTENAGVTLAVSAQQMMSFLKRLANTNTEISNVELAVTKMNASRETSGDFQGIVGQELNQIQHRDVDVPEYRDPEISSFAEHFDTAAGRATFRFGNDKVKAGRSAVALELRSLGHDAAQIAIADSSDDTVTYAVSIGKTAFVVPCKMSDAPVATVFICNGSVKALSRENIQALMQKEATDFRAAAAASPLYTVKPSELVSIVRAAMSEGNFARAEDALNVLNQSGDSKAYQTAFSAYMGGLNKTASVATPGEVCRCSRIVKTAHSQYEVCGHTGLPVHKVYQDKNGDCHPMYRKAMAESYEGGYFMNAKIFG